MIEWLKKIDTALFLFFNSMHSDFSDRLWLFVTNIPTWIPLYLILILIIIKVFRRDSFYIIAGVLLVILCSDQFTSSFMKPFFERLRPCHNTDINDLVHVAKNCGGKYGFASGHAANSFGIATFFWLSLRSYLRWTWMIFLWALIVAYSRIAIGVHYPGDIIVGGAVGMFFSWLVFKIVNEAFFRIHLEPLIKN